MAVELDEQRRESLVAQLRGFYFEDLDEEISGFRAEQLLDFFLEAVGPQVYNQAVQDARLWMRQKLDDLEGDVHVPELPL